MQKITSKDNPNIKLYVKLAGGRKYRKENGLFTLEGVRLVEDAVKENAELHSVFVTESYMKKLAQQGESLNFPNSEKVFEIPDEIGNKMSSTDSAQGVFAICKCLEKPSFDATVKNGGKYLLLHSIQDPGNLGTIIRTADAVGVDAVFLADCCDLYNPKVVRSTMGSLFRLNVSEIKFDETFPVFAEIGVPSFAAVIDSDATSLTDCDFSKGGVILIGNEGNGLPREVSDMCTERLTIKMQGNVNSLNAAMAAGIIMWELAK
ncbi:MAG: RNA methyltransferase [Oscillospiraceae bacterium]|nr:RNA methyltransferase [Oscillospiraceae bacterium]